MLFACFCCTLIGGWGLSVPEALTRELQIRDSAGVIDKSHGFLLEILSMVGMLVPLQGGRDYITPQKAIYIYKWYIGGIYCQLGDYMPPIPPFRGTRNNH